MHNGTKRTQGVNTVANTAVLTEVIKCLKNLGQGILCWWVSTPAFYDECPYKVNNYSLLSVENISVSLNQCLC